MIDEAKVPMEDSQLMSEAFGTMVINPKERLGDGLRANLMVNSHHLSLT
jgi:hypothetical protein